MKKLLFLAIPLLLMASCNDNKSHLNGQEAQPLTDTIQTSENTPEGTANDSAVSQAAPSIDESAINEIMQQQINEEYKKGYP